MLSTKPNEEKAMVLSYLGLRKAVGLIGFFLPIVLMVGNLWLGDSRLLPSISDYNHSVMRAVFVGGLCAVGVFLLSYRFAPLDDLLGDVAGVSAIGVALFPNIPDQFSLLPQTQLGWLHFLLAAVFLGTLAIFALVLFPRTDKTIKGRKKARNIIYYCCGGLMVLCLVLIELIRIVPGATAALQSLHPDLWLESIVVWAFGIAWLVKGRTIRPLNDRKGVPVQDGASVP